MIFPHPTRYHMASHVAVWESGRKSPRQCGTVVSCWKALPCVSTCGSYIVDFLQGRVWGSQGIFISSVFFSLAFLSPEPGYVVAPWHRECSDMGDHPGCMPVTTAEVSTAVAGRMGWLWSSGMGGPGLFLVWPEVAHTLCKPDPRYLQTGRHHTTLIASKEIKKLQVTKNNLSCGCVAVLLLVEVMMVAEGRELVIDRVFVNIRPLHHLKVSNVCPNLTPQKCWPVFTWCSNVKLSTFPKVNQDICLKV